MKPHRNHGLFSNYYLDELLPREEGFGVSRSELKETFQAIKSLCDKDRISSLNEPQLRKHFLDKVFDSLGWTIDVEPPTPSGEWSRHPDYTLFEDRESLSIAQKASKDEYFRKVLCVGEAKRWGRPLDKKLKTEADPSEIQNPSLQMSRYLWLTGVKWGILTDGRYWRLYERETSKRLDIFYEIDLEDLIENGSEDDFKYFYLFFRRGTFPDFLEKVYQESVDYAQAVGEKLKENVYQALKTLAKGFLKTSGNNISEVYLKEIHDNSLISLYRLLFILYAEYRGLLPLGENRFYSESYSLDALKKEIAEKLDRKEPIASSTFGYWGRLKELFEIINRGNRELEVPPYNGGLFDPDKHIFLEDYRVGDLYIARAVDLLSRSSDKAYIDYGSLEIRHLGSIYEGLLEYKLAIAEEDIVPIKEKSKEIFIPLEEARKHKKKIKEEEIVQEGEVYLVTDKGERKATGSYYTPHYIVKYIVENTLGPLIGERRKKVAERIREVKEKIRNARGQDREFYEKELREAESSLIDEILSIKVLDPAMGSGHFLVEATDFLARELLRALSGEPLEEASGETVIREVPDPYDPKESEDEDIRWARREVVEKCIFGVDLNPLAVELAKLSIWLHTVARNCPLNFLDHHLRCGNSLIGARIEDLASLPDVKKKKRKEESGPVQLGLFESIFKERVNILLSAFAQIEDLPSETVEQVRKKEEFYNEFRKIVSRFQDVEDVWISAYFGNDVLWDDYQRLQDNLRSTDKEWAELSQEPWFKKAKQIAEEKHFFHWELEFPEVFFEGHQRKENPGFDAVIGNPPYVMELRGNKEVFRELQNSPIGRRYYESKMDVFYFFIEHGIDILRRSGNLGFIIQEYWISRTHASKLRKKVFSDSSIDIVIDFKDFPVFPEAMGQHSMVLILSKNGSGKRKTKFYFLMRENPSEEDVSRALESKPASQDFFEVGELLPIYDETADRIYFADSQYPSVLGKIRESAFRLGEEEVQQGVVTPQHNLMDKSRSKLPNPDKHKSGEGIFVLSADEIKRYNWTRHEKELFVPFYYAEGLDAYSYEDEQSHWLIYTSKENLQRMENHPDHYPYIRAHLDQYQPVITSDNKPYGLHRARQKEWFTDPEKVIGVRKTHHPKFVVVKEDYFMDQSVLIIRLREKPYSPHYICAILNSFLSQWWLSKQKTQGTQLQIDKEVLMNFPICRISFVTPKPERERLMEEFKETCEAWLGKGQKQE